MNGRPNPALVSELRYALEVMEARSHLGLPDKTAGDLRGILLRRIVEAENALAANPAHPPLAHDPEPSE
jgi:hypothetical protein